MFYRKKTIEKIKRKEFMKGQKIGYEKGYKANLDNSIRIEDIYILLDKILDKKESPDEVKKAFASFKVRLHKKTQISYYEK